MYWHCLINEETTWFDSKTKEMNPGDLFYNLSVIFGVSFFTFIGVFKVAFASKFDETIKDSISIYNT